MREEDAMYVRDQPDTVHVSPWLVKLVSGSILAGLTAIGGYMVWWAKDDQSYKRVMTVRMLAIEITLKEIKADTKIIPINTQKIRELEKDVGKLEKKNERDHR